MSKKKTSANKWNTVTPFSKILATVLFVTLPFVGFYFGMQYQLTLDSQYMEQPVVESSIPPVEAPNGTACTMDAKVCPDGTAVGRTGPNCEFEACPGE